MKSLLTVMLAWSVLTVTAVAGNEAQSELKAFHPPPDGMQRFVILLPHRERDEEDAFAVELVAGRQMLTDGVNLVRLAGAVEARPLEGWGYTYYEVTGGGQTVSTMMAPPPGAPAVRRFVQVAPLRIDYNSRLPIVVYAPQGYEVRYRIWQAPETFVAAESG